MLFAFQEENEVELVPILGLVSLQSMNRLF